MSGARVVAAVSMGNDDWSQGLACARRFVGDLSPAPPRPRPLALISVPLTVANGRDARGAAECAERLVSANNLSTIVKVLKGKIEEVELPEQVDVIVSEPIGFLLVR